MNEQERQTRRGRPRKWVRVTSALLVIGIICCVLAWLLLMCEVRTVLASGPTLVVVGVLTVLFASCDRLWAAAWIGAAHIGVSVLFFTLVNALDWQPHDAEIPFALMGVVYVAIVGPLSWRIQSRLPKSVEWGACEGCGYLLFGLTEPRCPECGRPFDPKLLAEFSLTAE